MDKQNNSGFLTALIILIIGAIAMAISPVFIRIASREISPFAAAFWRVFLALPFLFFWMLAEHMHYNKSDKNVKLSVFFRFRFYSILAGIAFAGDLFFWHLAVMKTSIANATFLATMTPVFIIFLNWLFYNVFPQMRSVCGVLICLVGGGVLAGGSLSIMSNSSSLQGDGFALITALFFSLYFMAVQKERRNCKAAFITFQLSCVTALCLLFVALFHTILYKQAFFPSTWEGISALFGMAVISQVCGQGLLAVSLGRLPAVFSSLVIFIEALSAAFFGWIFMGEVISYVQYYGGLLILIGIWIARPVKEKSLYSDSKNS